MPNHIKNCNVAIIGLGPVGTSLANILGQFGISTAILDRRPSACKLPRAVTFDDEVMRIFQSMGLSESMNDISEVGGSAHFVDAESNVLVTWERPQILSPNNWYVNYRFHQPDLEGVLRDGLKRYSCVSEYWGCNVIGIKQDNDGVTLRYTKPDSGEEFELRAAYVVGCDGARSFTRVCMNSGLEDLGFREPWLVVDLKLKELDNDPDLDSYHFCEPERSGTRVFVGKSRKRWEFRLNMEDEPTEMSNPENVWQLLKKWIGPNEAELERATVYTFHSTIAETWRHRRLLIAGDAAHQTPPFMGQGMCAGIRDAANLGWKLERILKHDADDSLLESYQSERYAHVRKFIDLTIQMGGMINRTATAIISGNITNPEEGPQKLNQLRPRLGPGLAAGRTKLSGQLFPQPRLQSGELLDDRIGNRPALILLPGFRSELSSTLEMKLSETHIAIIDDTANELQDWLNAIEVNAVFIRPDRYIIGTAITELEVIELINMIE